MFTSQSISDIPITIVFIRIHSHINVKEYLVIKWFEWMENWYLIGLTSEVRRLKFSILRQTSKMWSYHEWHICFHAHWSSSITQTKFGSVSIKLHVKPGYLTVAKIVSRQMETHKNMINRISSIIQLISDTVWVLFYKGSHRLKNKDLTKNFHKMVT